MRRPTTQSIRLSYLDFELEIGRKENDIYPVAVVRSPAGEARGTMWFPFTEADLEHHLDKLQIALLRSGGSHRVALSEEEQVVQAFGQELFKMLFTGDVYSLYVTSRQYADHHVKGLRVKLRILAPEMAALPWEFLFDPSRGDYVCLSARTPVIRYLELLQPSTPLTVKPPLRILGMIASPRDLVKLDIAEEKRQVDEALQQLHARGLVEFTWLPGQTWRDLQQALQGGGPWHIFHFIGHAGFDRRNDEGYIYLVDKDGDGGRLSARKLARLLEGHTALRLVLLNACEGGHVGKRDVFTSTAATLIQQGIPAVLAMQYAITDQAALEFARSFYGALADGLPIDTSVISARKAISFAIPNTIEWGTPVLYMRSPDGILFNIQGQEERLAREKADAELFAKEKAAAEAFAREQAERERVAREQAELLAKEKAAAEALAHEQAERQRLAREKAEAERLAEQKADAEALAREQAERERLVRERAEAELLAKQKAASEALAREQARRKGQAFGGKFEADKLLAIKILFMLIGMMVVSLSSGFILAGAIYKDSPTPIFSQTPPPPITRIATSKPTTPAMTDTPITQGTLAIGTPVNQPTLEPTMTIDPASQLPPTTNAPVIAFDPTQLRQIASIPGEGQIYGIAWSPDGTQLAVNNTDGIRIWDVDKKQTIQFLPGPTCFACGLAWSSDGQRLAVGLGDVTIRVWDVPNGKIMFNLRGHAGWVSSVAWSSDGNLLASGSNDTTIHIWDMSTGKLLHTLTGHMGDVNSVAWSPDDTHLASGSSDDMVKIWDVVSEKALLTLTRRTDGVLTVAWARDGIRLAAGSSNGTLRVWDTTNGTELVKMTGHTGDIYSVAWLADDQWLASGSSDLTIRVWDATTGELLKTLPGHKNYVHGVAWSPRTAKLASADLDGAIIIWGIP